MGITIELPSLCEQLHFNRSRWKEVCADPYLNELPYKIETDRYGNIVMSPPPRKRHGQLETKIVILLDKLMREGVAAVEQPVSTSDGVKAADVIWCSAKREEQSTDDLYDTAPEICVEVISPGNRKDALDEKKNLYFEAGAEEVWFCTIEGKMQYYLKKNPEVIIGQSELCSAFPRMVEI